MLRQKNRRQGFVVIEKGIMLPKSASLKDPSILIDSAPIDKKSVGVSGNSLISLLCINYSTTMAAVFMTEAEQISYRYSALASNSMSFRDCLLTDEYMEKIQNAIKDADDKCKTFIEIEADADMRENKINAELNSLMNIGTVLTNKGLQKSLSRKKDADTAFYKKTGVLTKRSIFEENALNLMRLSGAKGSIINCFQISAFVGQQNVDGERAKLVIRGERATCSQIPGDLSPGARGLITHSYLQGKTPSEMFWAAQAARRGIVDTGLKTSETGYASKKLVKKMDDYRIYVDGTVRNATDHIIQFLYGGDGFDCARICSVNSCNTPLFCDLLALAKTYEGKIRKPIQKEIIEGFLLKLKMGQPGFQTCIHQRAARNFRNILRPILEKIELPSSKVKLFLEKVLSLFEKSKVAYGEMVGLSASSSVTRAHDANGIEFFSYMPRCWNKGYFSGRSSENERMHQCKFDALHFIEYFLT